jgi:hypothetical protein
LFSSGFIAAKSMQFNGSESGHARHVFIASIRRLSVFRAVLLTRFAVSGRL